jgi:hypothetical protein
MTLIEHFLPVYQFREHHQLAVSASPAHLLDAVTLPGTMDDPWVKAFIRLRELPGRVLGAVGRPSALRHRAAFGLEDFTLLGRDANREIAFGLAGRFWRSDYGLVALADAEEFAAFTAVGIPKLVLNFTVETSTDGRVWLHTETRVHCNDRKSLILFVPYWSIIRPVSGLMRHRLLARIRDAAAQRRD